jgi:hypothetical protein
MRKKIDSENIKELAEEVAKNSMISYSDLPQYDLFLSQVIDFLNDKFVDENYTNNIVQNYIKSGVITKPEDGKKRGYTKMHLAQLVLLSNMRPVLTTEEIKKVFKLAFNEIDDRNDDIISWEAALKIFTEIQRKSFDSFIEKPIEEGNKLDEIIKELNLDKRDEERIRLFVIVISLGAQASVIKKLVQKIVSEYGDE